MSAQISVCDNLLKIRIKFEPQPVGMWRRRQKSCLQKHLRSVYHDNNRWGEKASFAAGSPL